MNGNERWKIPGQGQDLAKNGHALPEKIDREEGAFIEKDLEIEVGQGLWFPVRYPASGPIGSGGGRELMTNG